VQRKAKEETVRRAQARRTKQWTDAEWKEQVLEKLGKVDELVVQVWRVADALERIVGMRSKTLEDDTISWPESGGKETETLERMDKGKGREIVEEEYDNEWSNERDKRDINCDKQIEKAVTAPNCMLKGSWGEGGSGGIRKKLKSEYTAYLESNFRRNDGNSI